MKYNTRLLLAGILLWFCQPSALFAQTDAALLRDLAEENKKSVEALVLYPSDARMAILESTKYPQVLIRMQDMRIKTSAAFRTLIEDFPRTTQAVFYDINRYPGLTGTLVNAKNDPKAIQKALEIMPLEKRDETFGVVTRQMPTLVQIDALNTTTQNAFQKLTSGYPPTAQQAFGQLLGLPEVIELLNEDLKFTILVGETYRDNPAWVIGKMDSLNLEVARSHAEELENWKTAINNDPEAKAELQQAAKAYSEDISDENDGYSNDDLYADGDIYDREPTVIYNNYYAPYPYWYGYPWWDPYPRWNPYPWWWDWGFRYQPHGIAVVYLPSYHFMHWYFEQPYHHYQYNHLSTHFVNHYNGHRHSGTSVVNGVREWHENNRTIVSNDFLNDTKKLPDNLKEYGRFEQGRQEYNTRNPQKAVTPEQYLDNNVKKYPELQRSRTTAKTEIQQEKATTRTQRADWAPTKAAAQPEPATVPKTERPARQQPANTVPTEKPVTREPIQPRTTPNEAKDYHRQKWEEIKPPPVTPRVQPQPRSQPQPRVQPKPQVQPKPAPAPKRQPVKSRQR